MMKGRLNEFENENNDLKGREINSKEEIKKLSAKSKKLKDDLKLELNEKINNK